MWVDLDFEGSLNYHFLCLLYVVHFKSKFSTLIYFMILKPSPNMYLIEIFAEEKSTKHCYINKVLKQFTFLSNLNVSFLL